MAKMPIDFYTVTSNFAENRGTYNHSGVDLAAPTGTSVKSMLDGTVLNASYQGSYGNLVTVRSSDGTIQKFAHLSGYNVKVGDNVKAGTIVGKVGSTGNSTGPHLHYEIVSSGKNVNPLGFNFGGVSTGFSITENLNNESSGSDPSVSDEIINTLFKVVVYIIIIIVMIVSLLFVFIDYKTGIKAGVKGGLAYATGGTSLLFT